MKYLGEVTLGSFLLFIFIGVLFKEPDKNVPLTKVKECKYTYYFFDGMSYLKADSSQFTMIRATGELTSSEFKLDNKIYRTNQYYKICE